MSTIRRATPGLFTAAFLAITACTPTAEIAENSTSADTANKGTPAAAGASTSGHDPTSANASDGKTPSSGPVAGTATVFVAASNPQALSVNKNFLYWNNVTEQIGTGAVMTTPRSGGPSTAIAKGQTLSTAMAFRDGNYYWTNSVGADGDAILLTSVGAETITLAAKIHTPQYLAVDDAYVYWTDRGTYATGFTDGAVMKVPLEGGDPIALLSPALAPSDLAIDGTNIYWSNGAQLFKMPLQGGTPTVLAEGVEHFAIDAANVYWTHYLGSKQGSLMKAPLAGGAPITLASGLTYPSYVTVDGTNAYWTGYALDDAITMAVMKVPVAGGTASMLAKETNGNAFWRQIVVAGSNVYWTSDTAVMSLTMP